MPINLLTEEGFGMIVGSAGASFTGLLDEYGGAAAAYSVRRLSSTYTGNLIEVRRSSDNTTQDIGYDANGDLDTTALLAFVGAGDGFVRTWYDQSGNANNAQQTTTSEQPQIVSSGSTILENGKAALEFDGVNDHLRDTFTIGNPVTLFVTAQAQTTNDFIIDTGVGSNINSLWTTTNVDQIRLFNNNKFIIVSYTHGTQALFSVVSNGSSSSISVNGLITNGTLGTQTMDGVSMGVSGNNGLFLNGTIQEIIIYPSNQSANRTVIEGNINSYYSIY